MTESVQSTSERLAEKMKARADYRCEPGLTAAEIRRAEDRFGFKFPPMWRGVLTMLRPVALPIPPCGPDGILRWSRFPDWRLRDESERDLVTVPIDGLLFDVEHCGFWWTAWGDAPLQARIA